MKNHMNKAKNKSMALRLAKQKLYRDIEAFNRRIRKNPKAINRHKVDVLLFDQGLKDEQKDIWE